MHFRHIRRKKNLILKPSYSVPRGSTAILNRVSGTGFGTEQMVPASEAEILRRYRFRQK